MGITHEAMTIYVDGKPVHRITHHGYLGLIMRLSMALLER